MSDWNKEDEIYLRIDRFVGDYYLVLDMRDAVEDGKVHTTISIAHKDWKKDKDTHWFGIDDNFSHDYYNFSTCKSLQLFKDLIICIEVDGEKGLLEFIDDNLDLVTKGGINI